MIVSVPIFEQPYLITTYSPECVEKLSEKGFECRSGRVFGPSMGAKTGPTGRFVHLRGRVSGASGTFRTVSCTEFFEVRMGSVQHPCCRGVPNATKRLKQDASHKQLPPYASRGSRLRQWLHSPP